MKAKMVLVVWEDANSCLDYYRDPDYHTISVCEEVGFLEYKDKNKLILTTQHFEDGDMRHVLVLPLGCVKSIKELKVV